MISEEECYLKEGKNLRDEQTIWLRKCIQAHIDT
jgi:hypothetical protein